MSDVRELFASNVFNDAVMKEKLPKETYKALKKSIADCTPLDYAVAQVVATAMKDWAIEKGATHFTHWFQPMTGITAEKRDAFISPTEDGKVILEFSGKELIMGEPDASSFPSGGLRATFEARGYTAWDPSSYAFVKDYTLYIPTAFCSYTGEVLDKKTPLLRSMDALNKQALRVLKLFSNPASRVLSFVGPEQEYFLVDEQNYMQRKDLILTGRTLFGAKPPKGQELEDHYFGSIKERISAYMKELDEELWRLGVLSKTKHNEVAPAQHEMAPVYSSANVATDHNQLAMELMKKVALRHGLVCLLHEKPFAGVNGSGKHNNWSMGTNLGENLLKPGEKPSENIQFLVFLAAVIQAVDEYSDLLRVSVATSGNDHRLGANEAPPAIVSVFLGSQLSGVLDALEVGGAQPSANAGTLSISAGLPVLDKDNTDRNRTSPFAFTGNKFEFRMAGSSQSIAGINIVINSIVAETLRKAADKLEGAADLTAASLAFVKETYKAHKRIVFNGNNYAAEWVAEAAKRGLPNKRAAVESLPDFVAAKNEQLFISHGVFTKAELHSRYDILLEDYSKAIHIEALTMLDMARQQILPAVLSYTDELLGGLALKKDAGIPTPKTGALAKKIAGLAETMLEQIDALAAALEAVEAESVLSTAQNFHAKVVPAMVALRKTSDELELLVAADYWPLPTYAELLFNV